MMFNFKQPKFLFSAIQCLLPFWLFNFFLIVLKLFLKKRMEKSKAVSFLWLKPMCQNIQLFAQHDMVCYTVHG